MEIKVITPEFSAATQVAPSDMEALVQAGYASLINNRPDGEMWGQPRADQVQAAAQAAGLTYTFIPVRGGVSLDQVDAMRAALAQATGPVLAFCRSGTRSTMLWALARATETSSDALITAAAQGGYDLSGLKSQLDALHQQAAG